jgi:predicted RNase H-like nuclease (RuvC/YqgF family)
MCYCLREQVDTDNWIQKVEAVQERAQWEAKCLENYIAFLQGQLAESHKVNAQLTDELHKLQQLYEVRQAGFSHTIYSLTLFP